MHAILDAILGYIHGDGLTILPQLELLLLPRRLRPGCRDILSDLVLEGRVCTGSNS